MNPGNGSSIFLYNNSVIYKCKLRRLEQNSRRAALRLKTKNREKYGDKKKRINNNDTSSMLELNS